MITTITLNPSVDRMYFIDSFDTEKVVRCSKYNVNAGGKGLNVTKVLRQLGADVKALGFLGGTTGTFIANSLYDIGVINSFTKIKAHTRSCLSIKPQVGRQFELVERGPEISPAEKGWFLKNFEDSLKEDSVIVISGSIPKGVREDFYRTLIERGKLKNIKVILDTSGKALVNGLKAKPYLVKPNIEELTALLGRELHTEEEILQGSIDCLHLGAQNVAVSLGGQGMIFTSNKESYRVRVPSIDLVSTVGSGDSTVAGLAYGLSQGMEIEEMLTWANACGASNATKEAIGCIDIEGLVSIAREIEVVRIR